MALQNASDNISQNLSIGIKLGAQCIILTAGLGPGVRQAGGGAALCVKISGFINTSGSLFYQGGGCHLKSNVQ